MIYDSVRLDPLYGQLSECITLERMAKRCPPLYVTGAGGGVSGMLCAALAADFAPLLILAGSERDAARLAAAKRSMKTLSFGFFSVALIASVTTCSTPFVI